MYDATYLSFGGGVQSTALMILSALGKYDVPKADAAIFADTQGELPATYAHIARMQRFGDEHRLPLFITTAGSLEEDVLVGVGKSHASIPAFIRVKSERPCHCRRAEWIEIDGGSDTELIFGSPDSTCLRCMGSGKVIEFSRGIQRRICTYDYKLMAIQAKTRELLGLKKGERAKGVKKVQAMMGISFDELVRMKPSKTEWIENSYPLVDARLTREDCKKIIADHGFTVPPRSSCYFCPYHRDRYWKWLKTTYPDQFDRAIAFDAKLRHSQPGLDGEAFLHDSLKPLSEIDFDDKQKELGFNNECEGSCGV